MELAPSQETLEQIKQSKTNAILFKKFTVDQETIKLHNLESLQILTGFEKKMKLPVDKPINDHHEIAWVNIKDDDTTATTLQARLTYRHISMHTTDQVTQIDESTFYDLQVRFVKKDDEEASSTIETLAQIYEGGSLDKKQITIRAVLGMESGKIDLTGNSDINPEVTRQALEIEREVLDPIHKNSLTVL